MSLHIAGVCICHLSHGCAQQAPKNQAFLCLCFLGVSTLYVLCPTHMDKMGFCRKVSQKIRFVEKETEVHPSHC